MIYFSMDGESGALSVMVNGIILQDSDLADMVNLLNNDAVVKKDIEAAWDNRKIAWEKA